MDDEVVVQIAKIFWPMHAQRLYGRQTVLASHKFETAGVCFSAEQASGSAQCPFHTIVEMVHDVVNTVYRMIGVCSQTGLFF